MFEKLKLKYLLKPYRMIKLSGEVNREKRSKLEIASRKLAIAKKKRIFRAIASSQHPAILAPLILR